MSELNLSPLQRQLVESDRKLFLEGEAGVGKTTTLMARLRFLLDERRYAVPQTIDAPPGISSPAVLVLLPERSKIGLFAPIVNEIEPNGSLLDPVISTFYQLARDGVTTYWPLIAADAGFKEPDVGPTWLTYDMAQVMMWEIVTPMLSQGYFADLRLRPQQIISQLLDNLRRAAFNRLSVEEAIEKQLNAWARDDQEHRQQLTDARQAAQLFRQRCFEDNLLDTSMIISVFDQQIYQNEHLFSHFTDRFKHLLVDNLEEQTPFGQAFINRILQTVQTSQRAYDYQGGYKRLLSASPLQAKDLKAADEEAVVLDVRFGIEADMFQLAHRVSQRLGKESLGDKVHGDIEHLVLDTVYARYRREMVELIGPRLAKIMENESIDPSNVAIVIPYLDGALQFKLIQSLEAAGLPYFLSRRRSTPREEPLIRAWVTWMRLAFHHWASSPSLFEVSEAFSLTIHALDPARAALVSKGLYDPLAGQLADIEQLSAEIKERIGDELLVSIEKLLAWINGYQYRNIPYRQEIDFFLYYLFDELLSQDGFYLETERLKAAAVCSWLIDMATRLKGLGGSVNADKPLDELVGDRFINGIFNGLVTSDPPPVEADGGDEGIFIGSIQGFLLSERQVDLQVWLEVSGNGWWDLPRQPLSNPFVLDSQWSDLSQWTLAEDARIRNELLINIVQGLCSRCRRGIILTRSDLDRRGARQDGPLWRALI